jgi:hypothetical protein
MKTLVTILVLINLLSCKKSNICSCEVKKVKDYQKNITYSYENYSVSSKIECENKIIENNNNGVNEYVYYNCELK